jgi:hypothetical protein
MTRRTLFPLLLMPGALIALMGESAGVLLVSYAAAMPRRERLLGTTKTAPSNRALMKYRQGVQAFGTGPNT